MTVDQYRSRANECIAAARQMADPERKVSLLQLAQRWMLLADDHSHGSRGDALSDSRRAS
jgi:hypothetical protein